jgi:xanthine dehydrogenase YagR molybdenum-binding subunit
MTTSNVHTPLTVHAIGRPLDRIDGPKKVTGTATYSAEYQLDDLTYAFPVQSTIAKGRITSIDAGAVQALPGVVAILWHENAPRLASVDNPELAVLQSDTVAYHGQLVAVVVAETSETARHAAGLIAVRYDEQPHGVRLSAERGDLYRPERVNTNYETDTTRGDVEAALESAAISLDHTYTTPTYHNNPLEPHATVAVWQDQSVTLYDANQGPHRIRDEGVRGLAIPASRMIRRTAERESVIPSRSANNSVRCT